MNNQKNVPPFAATGDKLDESLGRANFIVGCLVHEQIIDYDREQVEAATKLIAAILREFPPCPGDHFVLPFQW